MHAGDANTIDFIKGVFIGPRRVKDSGLPSVVSNYFSPFRLGLAMEAGQVLAECLFACMHLEAFQNCASLPRLRCYCPARQGFFYGEADTENSTSARSVGPQN